MLASDPYGKVDDKALCQQTRARIWWFRLAILGSDIIFISFGWKGLADRWAAQHGAPDNSG
jgi:hypothetical protein